jgi:peroxiredoxin Q/BCP
MKNDFNEFVSRKAIIAVVAPHDADDVAEYWKREGLPMIGIPDKDGKLAGLYGQEWKLFKLGRMPALFVIESNGVVAYTQYGKSMSDIPENSEILKVLDALK